MAKFPHKVVLAYREWERILNEIRDLERRLYLSEPDIQRLVFLHSQKLKYCPMERFMWVDGRPIVDLWKTIISEGDGNYDLA